MASTASSKAMWYLFTMLEIYQKVGNFRVRMSTSSTPFSNDHLSDAQLVIPQTVRVVQWERDINYLRELAYE